MAREAKVFINAVTGEAESSVQDLEEDLRDVEDAADDADRATSSVGGADAAASMQTASAAAEEHEEEISQLARRYGLVGRAADAAGGDVEDVGRVFDQLDKKTVAVLGSITALTGAFVAAGGLAAAATVVAAKFGPQGLQRDITNLRGRAENAARTFAREFEPVIRSQVLPVIRQLITSLEQGSDEFAAFSDAALSQLTAFAEASEGGLGGGGGLAGLIGRPVQSLTNLFGADFSGPGGATLSLFERPEEPTDAQERRDALEETIRKLDKLFRKRQKNVEQQEILQAAGKDRTKVLKAQIDAITSTRDKAALFAATLEKGSIARRTAIKEVEVLTKRVQSLKSQLQSIRLEGQLQKIANRIAPLETINARRAAEAGREMGFLPRGAQMQDLRGHEFTMQGTARMMQQAREMRLFGGAFREANEAQQQFTQNTQANTALLISQASQLGVAFSQAFGQAEVQANQLIGTLLTATGGIISAIPGAGPIAPALFSGLGNIVGSFRDGGEMPRAGIARLHPPEIVTGLPQGAQIVSREETLREIQNTARPREVNVTVEGELSGEVDFEIGKLRTRLAALESKVEEVS